MSSLSNVSTRVTRQSARTQQAERAIDTTPLHPTKGIDALSKFTDFEDRLNQATNQYQNELHQQRLEYIRKQLQEAKKDDWKYPPIESLLGYSRN